MGQTLEKTLARRRSIFGTTQGCTREEKPGRHSFAYIRFQTEKREIEMKEVPGFPQAKITKEEKLAFLASSEMSYDPMYQPSMDMMYHLLMQDKWVEVRKAWPKLK